MLKESLKACCRTSVDSAEEFNGLKKGFEQERQIQQDEIHSLKAQLERMTNKLQDVESTLKKELAEKEASKVPTSEQFLTHKERQSLLKDEITIHQNKAQANLVAYRKADRALVRERTKTADLHRKLEELNNKLAENSGKCQMAHKPQESLRKKDVSTRKAVDQDRDRRQREEGWTWFRCREKY
ncbi:hypothetical protein SKAU_G00296860 [Synaphobranchus kaupii]|uniref:Uncharacterized protein n=1 Tax=Synaphobranchus kaupii TaxID=118154 RepID=A0A9Q1IMV0_SYNKA|nr:hypothetical protein SKAU_G00296860 [Synaphobranchus kaupii]